jgi:hypothetical protein
MRKQLEIFQADHTELTEDFTIQEKSLTKRYWLNNTINKVRNEKSKLFLFSFPFPLFFLISQYYFLHAFQGIIFEIANQLIVDHLEQHSLKILKSKEYSN